MYHLLPLAITHHLWAWGTIEFHSKGIVVCKYPSDWATDFSEEDDEIGTRTAWVSGTIKGINHKRNRIVETGVAIKLYKHVVYSGLGENAEFEATNKYVKELGLISTNHAVASHTVGQQWLECKKEGNEKSRYYINVFKNYQAIEQDNPVYMLAVAEIYNEDPDNVTALDFIANILQNMYLGE